jgi:arylformamidase
MELRVKIANKVFRAVLSDPNSLAIPLLFDGAQPEFFGAAPAKAIPYQGEGFVGDTAQGGSCNVSEINLVPHCNGTHTENVGHIVQTPVPVSASVEQGLMAALVISVAPTADTESGDWVISRESLVDGMEGANMNEVTALVVRTLPNTVSKKSLKYGNEHVPPYFAAGAMRYIVDTGFQHLLVDLPSIDRMHDGGTLSNHRLFWDVQPGAMDATAETRTDKTVTEMIFVDDGVADGLYLLDLQVPRWHSDAAPSNPVLYPLVSVS